MSFKETIGVIGQTAPERLRGLPVQVIFDGTHITFRVEDAPDDITPNETGFLRLMVGELTDRINQAVPGAIGDEVYAGYEGGGPNAKTQ